MFRHTAATLMLENGADLRYIQELLGHASIKSTQVYTNVSAAHLKRTMNQSHPVTWEEEPTFSAGMHTGTSTARRCPRRKPGEERPVREVDPSRSALHGALCEYREWIMTTSSHGTAVLYVQHSGHFVEWADARGVTLPGRITPELVQQYQRELPTMKMKNGEPFSIHLIRARLQAVRSFFRHLWRSGHTLTDPAASTVVPRAPRHLPADVLTVEEVERILAMPDITTTYGIRDRAVIELFYATGMRRSELADIRLDDVNHENRTVRIVDAKTKDSRMLPVGSRAMRWIETYLECAREGLLRPGEEREHLFICGDGERFSPGTPETICRRHMRAAGVHKRKACHIFRHTVATLMLENGADVRAVQEFLGHRSVQSTERYTHVAIRKLREVHAKTHPGEKRYLERLREEELPIAPSVSAARPEPARPVNEERPA
jgi:integrase/recombinase XerD